MEKDLLETLDPIARQIARNYLIIRQTKLQSIEVDDDIFYTLVLDFFEFNVSDIDIEYSDLTKVMNNAFGYFYTKGIEAAINKHFNLSSELIYEQDEMIQLSKPNLPDSIDLYINYLALLEMSNSLNDYITINKDAFEKQAYFVNDLCEKVLLIAFQLGVELTTQIAIKSSDFGVDRKENAPFKVNLVHDTHDMSEIFCPFCNHAVYIAPKEKEFRDLSKINNCQHVSLQYFQQRDKEFLIGSGMRQALSEVAMDFLSSKSPQYVMALHNIFDDKAYSIDDLLLDLYVSRKISEEDENQFLSMLSEVIPNYTIRVSDCKINGQVIVNYFLEEKSF